MAGVHVAVHIPHLGCQQLSVGVAARLAVYAADLYL